MTDKKAAKKLAAELKRRQLQRDFLSREEALDKETLKKIKNKWFEILLRSKLPEMKENLRNVLDYMEKLVEVEMFRKRLFEEERIELDDQLNFQAQSQSGALENLYDIYLHRIHDLDEIYKEHVLKKKEEAEDEFQKLEEKERKVSENLKAILYQMELNEAAKEDSMTCEMFQTTDDEKSKNAEKSENLVKKEERQIEKRWSQISSTLINYQKSTEKRRIHYLQLKARDDYDSKIIRSQMKKIQKLADQIQQLKNSLENPDYSDKKVILISDYREERNKFYNSFLYVKRALGEEMRLDNSNLRYLTVISKETLDYLNRFLKKGERILTLFSLCLKFETEKEKIVPVGRTLYNTRIPINITKQLIIPQGFEVTRFMDKEAVKRAMLEELQYLWKKFGKVRLSVTALEQCISDLEAENGTLKRTLRSYLTQVSSKV